MNYKVRYFSWLSIQFSLCIKFFTDLNTFNLEIFHLCIIVIIKLWQCYHSRRALLIFNFLHRNIRAIRKYKSITFFFLCIVIIYFYWYDHIEKFQ